LTSLNLSLEKKLKQPSFKFFSSESGSLWQQLFDDYFDPHSIYLQACSEFPKYLEQYLDEKGETLDQLAGIVVSRKYPGVEDIVREGFLRSTQTLKLSKSIIPCYMVLNNFKFIPTIRT
jgi:hypothetical protein